MGNKFVLTVRFQPEGEEARLYRNIQAGKEAAGMSASEYVKKIVSEYFSESEKRSEAKQVLQEIREEYRSMAERIEQTIRRSIHEHDAILLGALGRMSGSATVTEESISDERETAELPEESREIPEEALDFLNDF